MKNIKKLIATLTLTGIIIIGATNARAGLMMSDFAGGDDQQQSQPCKENNDSKMDWGITINGFGITINGFGITINGLTDDSKADVSCGITING